MKFTANTSIPLLSLWLFVITSCGSLKNSEEDLVADSNDAVTRISQTDVNMTELFDNSVGYAVFPNVGKGAYVIGGASGNGTVYENGKLIGYADLKQVDVGLQIGGQAFIEVIFFNTQTALDNFKKGGYELAANASAVILDEGVSRDVEFQDGVAVITLPKGGAMAGISVGGQRFDFHSAQ